MSERRKVLDILQADQAPVEVGDPAVWAANAPPEKAQVGGNIRAEERSEPQTARHEALAKEFLMGLVACSEPES